MTGNQSRALITVLAASTALTGCLESGGKTNKNANPVYEIDNPNIIAEGTRPIFRPLDTAFPLPSDPLFFLNPERDGTMLNGTDPANPVTTGLGFVDGNSILAPFDIKISDSLDPNQTLDARNFVEIDGEVVPNPDQNIYVLEIEFPSGDSVFQQPREVGGLVAADQYRLAKRLEAEGDTAGAEAIYQGLLEERFRVEIITVDANGPAEAAGGSQNNAIRLLPIQPLKPKTKYAVAIGNKIVDKDGKPLVKENRFETASNPDFVISNPALQSFRDVMAPARNWTNDFFNFKREQGGNSAEVSSYDDITFAISFTTTAVEDVLLANAAPAAWFRQKLLIDQKQQVLDQVVSGALNFSNQTLEAFSDQDQQINQRLFELLTDQTYRLFNDELATILTDANDNGIQLRYTDLVMSERDDRQLAFTLQATAAQAVEEVVDVSGRAAELADQVAQVADLPRAHNPESGEPSPVRFFSQKDGGEVNPALEQVAIDLLITDVRVNVRVYEGEISLPYYQPLPEGTDGSPLQSGSWLPADFSDNPDLPQAASDRVSYRFPFAQKQGDTKVPIVVTAPDSNPLFGTGPADGYPVIIYQHAATQDRSAILPMATAAGLLCLSDNATPTNNADCFITVGIDLPLNGAFGEAATSANGGMVDISQQPGASADATERHFGFTAGPDMQAIPGDQVENPESGSLFLNFTNFANTRDNMRQSALDLLQVNALLPAIEQAINSCSECDDGLNMNTDRVYFISHSLSGMGGVPFPVINNLAAQDNPDLNPVLASVLFNTGGQFSRLAENSRETVAPVLLPTLDAASEGLLAQGRTELNIYFNVFQALLDSTDPVAFAPLFEKSDNSATLLTSIVGLEGDADRPSDGTIPNAADAELYDQGPLELVTDAGFQISSQPAPLAGTDPLARFMGAVDTGSDQNDGNRPVITRYLEGSHGNPVSAGQKAADPFSSSAVFDEMAGQMVALFRSKTVSGASFTVGVTNTCVVQGVGSAPGDAACDDQTDAGRDPSATEESEEDGGGLLDSGLGGFLGGLIGL
ncbi:hypothetical protein [Marinobacter halophilus]|uniref:Bacterial virulence factor lipase N-terminal domain-containing protein n=1 Tax=Marinobacter halophilus TaxID=1323740 RepID=A0A2T1KCF1_9GAMM|nr:hypothetical protein [Marinobacter halophilus]PSF07796.1 hypothetical protein C7H08_10315 [Marinobacter halophilus]GGC57126.1 hypothetical protein GCM10011362_01890 [Marinobacter halophilus]